MSQPVINRLKWRCRRGVKELDLLFGRILDHHFGSFSNQQQLVFERFLETPDPIIMDWVMRRNSDYPDEFGFVVELLIQE